MSPRLEANLREGERLNVLLCRRPETLGALMVECVLQDARDLGGLDSCQDLDG